MRDVYIAGVGQAPVSKAATRSVRELGADVVKQALEDAGLEDAGALYVGNMLSGMLSNQQQLGALIAHTAGLPGIEAATVEAACASGAAAARWGTMAIASGMHDAVIVCGVERMTHVERERVTRSLATASDWHQEGGKGETFVSLNAHLMRMYMERHGVDSEAFAPFALNAHRNSRGNPHALFNKKDVSAEDYARAKMIQEPVRLFDASPICDGAAAVVMCSREVLDRCRPQGPRVKVIASAVGTDSLALNDRRDPLVLDAAVASSRRAYEQAGIRPADVDLFELHDAYTVMSVLSLEAAGFADEGRGHELGPEIQVDGDIPVTTMGGLKGRGHPVGATGVYQLVESHLQLAERGGHNQVPGARIAMAQNFGGTAATVVTHLLERAA